MVYKWEPWTQYNAGAVVEYEGSLWQVVQPHQSEPNWQPPNTPALWNRLPEQAGDDYRSGNQHHGVEDHHRRQEPRHDHQPQPGGWGEHRDDHRQDEKNQGWLTEKRKHELEIGGGIVGALAIGAGIYAYSKHESEEKEEAKRAAWRDSASHQNWSEGAQARTAHYERGGSAPPVKWILVEGNNIPQDALVGGREHGDSLYLARSFVNGELLVGKAGKHLNDGRGGASIASDGREVAVDKYEVLVGEKEATRWVNHHTQSGPLRVSGWQPVEGGRDRQGKFVFVIQVRHEGGVHPGRYTEDDSVGYFAWGGSAVEAHEFNVLAYK